jgi:hypothetical protein
MLEPAAVRPTRMHCAELAPAAAVRTPMAEPITIAASKTTVV